MFHVLVCAAGSVTSLIMHVYLLISNMTLQLKSADTVRTFHHYVNGLDHLSLIQQDEMRISAAYGAR